MEIYLSELMKHAEQHLAYLGLSSETMGERRSNKGFRRHVMPVS